MVTDLQPVTRHSAAAKNHVGKAVSTLLLNHGPAAPDPSFPLTDYSITHILPFSLCHRTCLCFQIQVCLAGSVFTNDLIEAAVLRDFEEIGDKFCCAAEGSVPLSNPPLLAIPAGPVICSYVECAGGNIVRCLEQGLLRLEPVYPNLPKWEGSLPS